MIGIRANAVIGATMGEVAASGARPIKASKRVAQASAAASVAQVSVAQVSVAQVSVVRVSVVRVSVVRVSVVRVSVVRANVDGAVEGAAGVVGAAIENANRVASRTEHLKIATKKDAAKANAASECEVAAGAAVRTEIGTIGRKNLAHPSQNSGMSRKTSSGQHAQNDREPKWSVRRRSRLPTFSHHRQSPAPA